MTTTKKMQEVMNLLKAGHIIWESFTSKKHVAGRLHYNYQDASIIYDFETCITSSTSTRQIHSSIIIGLIKRNLINRKVYKHNYKGKEQLHYYYTLS